MYKNINSASRLHTLLEAAASQPNEAVWRVWANVFDVRGPSDTESAEMVSERLCWLQIELKVLRAQAEKTSFSPHLYESALSSIRSALSPLSLGMPWDSIRKNLTPDVLLALAFLNEVLPDEESSISAEELQEIESLATDLAASLAYSVLPEALRRLIDHHLDLIAKALAQYKIFGARALREAGRTALGEIVELKDSVQASKQSEELSKLSKLWKHVNTSADAALKAEKLAQLGYRAWEVVSGFLS